MVFSSKELVTLYSVDQSFGSACESSKTRQKRIPRRKKAAATKLPEKRRNRGDTLFFYDKNKKTQNHLICLYIREGR